MIGVWPERSSLRSRFAVGESGAVQMIGPPQPHCLSITDLQGLPEDARVFDVYYDMQKEWPTEALARREALQAKSS